MTSAFISGSAKRGTWECGHRAGYYGRLGGSPVFKRSPLDKVRDLLGKQINESDSIFSLTSDWPGSINSLRLRLDSSHDT
jgi:hypothetical protein